jgi:hypothetical protein
VGIPAAVVSQVVEPARELGVGRGRGIGVHQRKRVELLWLKRHALEPEGRELLQQVCVCLCERVCVGEREGAEGLTFTSEAWSSSVGLSVRAPCTTSKRFWQSAKPTMPTAYSPVERESAAIRARGSPAASALGRLTSKRGQSKAKPTAVAACFAGGSALPEADAAALDRFPALAAIR